MLKPTLLGPAQGCGGQVNVTTGAIGMIQSLSDSSGRYLNDQDCVWHLTAPDNKIIRVSLSDVSIENHGACQYDGLEVKSEIKCFINKNF